MLFADPFLNSVLSIGLVIIGIVLVVLIITMIGRILLRLVVGLVMNSILGFVALFLISWLFGITLAYSTAEIVAVIIFGLPAVGTMLLLKLVGGVALAITL